MINPFPTVPLGPLRVVLGNDSTHQQVSPNLTIQAPVHLIFGQEAQVFRLGRNARSCVPVFFLDNICQKCYTITLVASIPSVASH